MTEQIILEEYDAGYIPAGPDQDFVRYILGCAFDFYKQQVESQAAQPEWISTNDEMPPMFEPCIFAIKLKGYPDYKVIGTIDESGNINDLLGDDIGYTSDSIDSWMPAPPEKYDESS
jgi:hypothetical protein